MESDFIEDDVSKAEKRLRCGWLVVSAIWAVSWLVNGPTRHLGIQSLDCYIAAVPFVLSIAIRRCFGARA
jgi:hypothetical protein